MQIYHTGKSFDDFRFEGKIKRSGKIIRRSLLAADSLSERIKTTFVALVFCITMIGAALNRTPRGISFVLVPPFVLVTAYVLYKTWFGEAAMPRELARAFSPEAKAKP